MDKEFRQQIEAELRSVELPLFVAELECLRDSVSPTQGELSELTGKWLPQIIHQGMDDVPDAVVERILDNPRCLLQLQTEILHSRSAYWHEENAPAFVSQRRPDSRPIGRRLALAVGICASVGLVAYVVTREPPLQTWWKMGSTADVTILGREELYQALAGGVTEFRDSFISKAGSEQRLIDSLARFKDDCEEVAGWEKSGLENSELAQLQVLCVAWADKAADIANDVVTSTDSLAEKRQMVADFLSGIARDFSEMSGASYDSV